MTKYVLPTINRQTETVVLANGKFPSHNLPLSILNNCNYLVCCDGAINNLTKTNKEPDAIVGDCDSLSEENNIRYAGIIRRISEQDTNDQTKAIRFCIEQNKKDITILGATGKREDHTLGNISLLCKYMNDCNVEMVTDYGVFVAIDSTSVFESYKGQQVSLFCLDRKPLSVKGLVYTIDNQVFDRWWQATLNESEGDEFTVETEGVVIVFRGFVE